MSPPARNGVTGSVLQVLGHLRRAGHEAGYRLLADLGRVRAVLDALGPDRLEVSDRLTLRGLGRWASAAGMASTVVAHERVDGLQRAFSPLAPEVPSWRALRVSWSILPRRRSVPQYCRFAVLVPPPVLEVRPAHSTHVYPPARSSP